MATPLRSLVWKEWHERKWWLALGVAAVGLGVVYAVWDESIYRRHSPVAFLLDGFMVFGLFAAVFLAMRTALGETTQGTFSFSSSLPAPLRRQAWVRLGGAIVTIAGPICFGALAMSVLLATGLISQAEEWVKFEQIRPEFVGPHQHHLFSGLEAVKLVWTGTLPSIASSVELLLIIALIGARRRAEAHVGFIGAVLVFLWFILIELVLGVNNFGDERPFFGRSGMVLPGSLAITNSAYILLSRSLWPHLAVNLLLLTALAVWFTRRYGTQSPASAHTRWTWRAPALLSRLLFRWPGQWSALVWLDLRQAAPMALAGLGLALLSTLLETVSDVGFTPDIPLGIVRTLPEHTAIIAILWNAVVGAGVFASEFNPRLEQFWRSRPISPSAWFWVKYLCGLAAVLGALDLVPILFCWHWLNDEGSRYVYIACGPVLHAVIYALAVLGVCWLRRPVLCGLAAILSFFVSEIVLRIVPGGRAFGPFTVANNLFRDEKLTGGAPDFTQHGYPVVYGTVAVIILIASLVAWRKALRPSS